MRTFHVAPAHFLVTVTDLDGGSTSVLCVGWVYDSEENQLYPVTEDGTVLARNPDPDRGSEVDRS
jgi:hypothetical protein